MYIIPALDIKDGKIVKAYAGNRDNYTPLKIDSKDLSDPKYYINILKNFFFLKYIYIADLNSIAGSKRNWKILNQILLSFEEIIFWIDGGFSSFSKVREFESEQKKNGISNYKIVLGTESLGLNNFLKYFDYKKNHILSLDFNGKEKKWIKRISKINLIIILMFMKQIGGRGIDWKNLNKLSKCKKNENFIISGGLKFDSEKNKIKKMKYKGILTSNYIQKKISRDLKKSLNLISKK